MHCEDVRSRLLDGLDAPDHDDAEAVAHLERCGDCRSLADGIRSLEAQARVWHDLPAPPWNPDPAPRPAVADVAGFRGWPRALQQWFPVAASSAALLLALGAFVRAPAADAPEAGARPVAADPLAAPEAEILSLARRERRQELEAMTALLKAEMDRRNLETEESLKYIIAHQIASQRELDALRGRVLQAAQSPPERM